MSRGELFILSAPSGTGKTTLIHSIMTEGLAEFGGIAFSVSYTTRTPRRGEENGSAYHFVEHHEFLKMIEDDRFLEWAEVHNNYYGTAYEEVLPRLEQGIDVIMDIDVQGAERVLSRYPEAHSIFIIPPSYEALEERLAGRGLDDPKEISQRLAVSVWEIRRYQQYEYVIINDNAARASDVLAAIILEKRHRLERINGEVQTVLEDFRRSAESAHPSIENPNEPPAHTEGEGEKP